MFESVENLSVCYRQLNYCYEQTITQDRNMIGTGIHVEVLQGSREQEEECYSVMNFDNLYFDKYVIKEN